MTPQNTLFPSLVIAAASTVWGLYWVPLRMIAETGIGPAMAVVTFNLPALALTAVLFLWSLRHGLGRLGPAMAAGLLAGAGLGSYAIGLMLAGVVKATMLFYLTPVWGTVLAMLVLSERPGFGRWLALATSMVGLALILGVADEDISGFGLGELCGLASGLFWACAAVIMRREVTASVIRMAFFQFLGVTIFAIFGALVLTNEAVRLPEALLPLPLAASLLAVVTVLLIFWAVGKISPGRSGLLMMTEAVVAVMSAAIFLPEETLTPLQWAGAAAILIAAVIEVNSKSTA